MPGQIKTAEEIKIIRTGGKRLAAILDEVLSHAKPGVTTYELDQLAETLIIKSGGRPAFKHFQSRESEPPFPSTICASVNQQLVHTPASDYVLQAGDILTVDIGMRYPADGGLYTDMAKTIGIGAISSEAQKLLDVTLQSLNKAIAVVQPGGEIADIGRAVQTFVEQNGFSVVRQLVGHGVGYAVHEEPRVPNFVDSKSPKIKLVEGMVLAIEPMVNVGEPAVTTLDDGWTIATADGSLCAHFEHTVAVTANGAAVLTQR